MFWLWQLLMMSQKITGLPGWHKKSIFRSMPWISRRTAVFIFPSYLKHRDLVGAFSSAGNSPVLTQYLKESLKEILTEELGQINDYMGSIRPVVKTRIETEKLRRQVYQTILARLLAEKKTSLLPEELEQILIQEKRMKE